MFVPGLRPPDEAPQSAAWFAFRGDRLLVRSQPEGVALLDYDALGELGASFESGHYLGRLADVDCYALQLHEDCECPEGSSFEGLRALFGQLPEGYFTIAGRAIQILHWDQTHRFCGRCGEPTVHAPTERAKLCPKCGLLSFPRLSPAVIMLIQRGEDFLLARNVNFPDAFYSVLAGFVEPGESLEEAVAREIHEEVGLEVTDIRYFGSQPWPFPHSLMIGFTTQFVAGEIREQADEIMHAAWFSRRGELPKLPGRLSIARRLIDWFLTQSD